MLKNYIITKNANIKIKEAEEGRIIKLKTAGLLDYLVISGNIR